MSTATLPAVVDSTGTEIATQTIEPTVSAETMEAVMLAGDLSKLSPRQRIEWYRGRCEVAGLDPRTQPFQYLTLNGKLVLYATKAASETLTGLHGLTVEVVERTINAELGLCIVRCKATFPGGRHVEDLGAVSIQGLKGEPLANALMKAVTKAKRRTILSACGLGELDESEVESTPGGVPIPIEQAQARQAVAPDNRSGYGRGQYASPTQVDAYNGRLRSFVDAQNARWLDEWTDEHGQVAEGIGDLLRPEQVNRHLLKWALRTERLAPVGVAFDPETGKPTENVSSAQSRQYVAIVFAREPEALAEEATVYARAKAQEAREAWRKTYGPPEEDEGSGPGGEACSRTPGEEG